MSGTIAAKLKFILPTLRTLNERALATELDKLCEGTDVMEFYKNLNVALNIKKKNILFIGAPGSGKGTYSRIISPILQIPTFGSGDYMKKEIANKTAFGLQVQPFIERGELAPDNMVLPVIQALLKQPIYKGGVILDGFPRTTVQADAIANSIPIDLVMHFHLPREVLIEKLMGRRVCPHCGRSYNVASIMNGGFNLPPLLPEKPNECDNCHEQLIQRSDDKRDVIENRLGVYERQTAPLIEYFGPNGKNVLRTFTIKKGVADVPDILKMMMMHYISGGVF